MHYTKRPRDSEEPKLLPLDYVVGPYVVMIGRGRRCLNNEGNRRFRAMVKAELQAYSAGRKAKKSSIIKRILREIRNNCVDGVGFIKQDAMTGRYYTATTTAAKVTIAQAFRDALNDTIGYKSSKQHKQFKRDIARGKIDPETLIATADELGVCSSCKEELKPGMVLGGGDAAQDVPPKPANAEPSLHFWKSDMGPVVDACEGNYPEWTNGAPQGYPQEAFPVVVEDNSPSQGPEFANNLEYAAPMKKEVDPFAPIPLETAMEHLAGAHCWGKHPVEHAVQHGMDCSERSSSPSSQEDTDDEEDHAIVAWASEFVHCPLCSLVQGRGDVGELPIHDIRKALIG